jgi:hypothetical protein
MRLLVEVFNTGDYRHLLIKYDESVTDDELKPYFDIIMEEYQKLSGNSEYSYHLQKLDDRLYKELVIRSCSLTISCIRLGCKEDAKALIDDFKLRVKIDDSKVVDYKAIGVLTKKIKQIQTSFKINEIQEQEDKSKQKSVEWEDMIVHIHSTLSVQIDNDCSVKLYLSYEKQAERVINAKKKNAA